MKPYVVSDNAAVVDIDDGYYKKESIDTGNIAILLLITLFDRILLTVYGRQRQSIAPA